MFDIIPETLQIRRAGNFKVVYGVLPSATVAGALEACSASDALHQRFQGSSLRMTWRHGETLAGCNMSQSNLI